MAQDDFLQFQERVKQAESGGRRFDKSGKLLTSAKGAQGEMQVMPGTQTDPGFGVVPAKDASPDEIARVGRDYLAAMEKRYGDRSLAAIAYNMGPGATDKWIAKGSDFSKLPAETQAYVQAVMGGVPSATAQVSAAAPSPKAMPAADMGVGYQAALALSFLNDQEDDDEKAVAKLDEEEDTQAAKMLAEYKPYNALAELDLTSTAPRQFSHGGVVHRADGSPESGEVTGINKLVDFVAQRLDPGMFPTSARTLLETVQGTKTPITESNFSPEERDIMRQLAVLKGGQKGNIDYGDYVKLAEQMKKTGKVPVSVTPGLLSMADPMGNVQTTLGRFTYQTDPKGNLQVVDRYDFNPIYDQGAMQEAQTGDYGALNPYGLVRNYAGQKIPPGKGREVLINLGPVKRAGGSPETGEELEPMEQRSSQGGYGNTVPPTRSAQQLQAYMESMNPTVQVSERPMEPGLLGYVQSDKILRNMGAPNVLHINTEQSPGNAEITKLHELEHALDVRGGDIKGRPDVRYSDNTMRAYYLMDNNWGPISQTVQNMVNNKEKLEKFFGRPIESGYFHPESLKNLLAKGNETALFKEQLATLSALEQVTGKSLTRDSEMRQLFPNTRMMAVYDALTGPRQTRMDARDLPPHTPQPSYTYETNPAMRFIKQHLGPKQEYGIPVKRADGSPETGERPLTAEEIEAASKPAFLTPKSGIGRKISTKPGQIEGAVAQGVSETPYNLVGAPVDIATMAMRPFGYSVDKPFLGSDWIKEKMSAAGVRPQPPSDPTSRAFYEIGQLGGGAINPAAPVRGAVAAAEKTGEAAKMLARDFQTYNQQLAVPGASYAVRTRGGPLLYTDQRLPGSWSRANGDKDLPSGFIDPVTAFINPIADVPDKPLKEWAQSKLGAYMRRDMGSPEDQFVKAADEGKRLHFMDKPDKTYTDEDVQAYIGWATRNMRDRQGFTPEGEALTKYGKMVEARIDLPIEPVSAESLLESFSAAREIPPQMLQHAKDYPYTTFYGLDVSLPGRLGLDTLVNSMYKARNSAPEFSAYGQPNVTIPERYRFTDATLQGLTPAQASERLAQSQSWFNDVRQKMASAAVKENKQLISKEYDNGSKWASFPDLAEHPDMLDMVKDVGCDGGWCTRGDDYALRYGSEEGKRLNVLFDAKARPKAQITLQTQAGTPNDFISNLTGKDYDNFLNRYPDVAKILENDAPASPWQFDAMLDDVALTPEYQAWASRQGAKITEIKGVNNTADLRKAPYLGEIHDFVKRMDKQYGLQAVDNLDGIGMVDLDSGLNMASPTWSAIFEAAGKQLPNGLVNQIIQRANTLNGGSNYAAVDEIRDLMKRATTEVLEREGHATGGMIERRIDDTRRYL